MYEYFYSEQAEQFAFYKIPKVLFTDDEFAGMSLEAKVLYGLLLDRMCLSRSKGWIDGHLSEEHKDKYYGRYYGDEAVS